MSKSWEEYVARKLTLGITELHMLITHGNDEVRIGRKTERELISEIEAKVWKLKHSSEPYSSETMNWRDEI